MIPHLLILKVFRKTEDIFTVTFLIKIVKLHLSSFSPNILTLTNNGLLTTNWLYSIFACSIYISFICSTQRDKIHPVSQEKTWSAHSSLLSMILDWNRYWSLASLCSLYSYHESILSAATHTNAYRSKQNQDITAVLLSVLKKREHTKVEKEILHDTVQTNVAFVHST